MPIRVTFDRMLAERGLQGKQVAARIGISETQLSMFRSGKVRGIRFSTLAKLCWVLECTPGDLLAYEPHEDDLAATADAGPADES